MANEISPGDHVKVTTDKEAAEGILIPTPALTGGDSVIIKLKTGYNMGILKSRIKKMELVRKYSPSKESHEKSEEISSLPVVSILSTGGTISSKVDYRTGGVYADYSAEDFVEMCPELKKIANIRAKKVLSLMSEDMLPSDWISIAKIIGEEIKTGVDGIVITHGTDTLHFTAAALSFFLKEINIPVIIIGSQRSIDRGSSDAFMNLICAVKAAAAFDAAEVMTCLHGSMNDDYCLLIRGTKVRKMHTSRRDAFRPVNDLPFAKVFIDRDFETISTDYKKADRKSRTKAALAASFEDKTGLFYVYPGMEPGILDYFIENGYRGVVIGATALGHVNTWTKKSLIPFIKKAYDRKIPVVIASQTLYGRVNPYVYTNLRKVSIEAKAIYAEDMLPEVAFIKLGWVLSRSKDYDKIKELFLENVKGEINPRHTPDMFLY